MSKSLIRVLTKATKRFGKQYPAVDTEYQVECTGVSKNGYSGITVFRDMRDGTTKQGTTFQVGDTAEYDSYNLSYTGKIVKITDKCVSIVAYPGSQMAKTHRLDINAFCWRNWDFDAVKTAERNSDTMMYI
jgi:hypothetical protein